MLNAIKIQGAWKGIEYNHKGPAHLSIGQEAASVGQCASLEPDDWIFGSHRSHGEILAKCLSRLAPAARARARWRPWRASSAARPCASPRRSRTRARSSSAEDFILFGTLAEIFARKAGFNRGPGRLDARLLHALRLDAEQRHRRRLADIATGAALFKRINRKSGIVVCNIGDASMGCGPVWEAMCLASMDQYRDALGQGCRRRAAHPLQLLQQLLRHGRPDRRRDHGLRRPGPGRRGRQPRGHARRARRRLQPARGRRRGGAQEEDPARGPRPRPPGHDHLPHLRPLALRRLELPHQGGDRALAGRRSDRSASPTTWSSTRSPTRAELEAAHAAVHRAAHRRWSSSPPATPSAPRVDGRRSSSR